jgi:hypothetical protein
MLAVMSPLSERSTQPGFLLVEILLGIAVFVLFVQATLSVVLLGREFTDRSGQRTRAVSLSQAATDGIRSIRDGNYSTLTSPSILDGNPHGVKISPSTKLWIFTGSQVRTAEGYMTRVTLSSAQSGVKLLSNTRWRHMRGTGSMTIESYVTNWRGQRSTGNWASLTLEGTYSPGGTPLFTHGVVMGSGRYLFVASQDPSGPGLYVLDISNPASPTRVSSSYSVGYIVRDLVLVGNALYLLTDDPSQEIKVVDVSNPTLLAQIRGYDRPGLAWRGPQLIEKAWADPITFGMSSDLPGSARGRSLAVTASSLLVGAAESSALGEDEFYAYQLSATGTLVLQDSLNDSGDVNAIAVSGTSAYLASSVDDGELRVVNVADPYALVMEGSYNLSDGSQDGLSMHWSGSAALLGRAKTSQQEVVLFDARNGDVPVPPPGPWYKEGSGSAVEIDSDPPNCYAFLAASSGRKAFQVLNLRSSSLTELATYNSSTGLGRGLVYDPMRDRVYVFTEQAVLFFKPGTATQSCL